MTETLENRNAIDFNKLNAFNSLVVYIIKLLMLKRENPYLHFKLNNIVKYEYNKGNSNDIKDLGIKTWTSHHNYGNNITKDSNIQDMYGLFLEKERKLSEIKKTGNSSNTEDDYYEDTFHVDHDNEYNFDHILIKFLDNNNNSTQQGGAATVNLSAMKKKQIENIKNLIEDISDKKFKKKLNEEIKRDIEKIFKKIFKIQTERKQTKGTTKALISLIHEMNSLKIELIKRIIDYINNGNVHSNNKKTNSKLQKELKRLKKDLENKESKITTLSSANSEQLNDMNKQIKVLNEHNTRRNFDLETFKTLKNDVEEAKKTSKIARKEKEAFEKNLDDKTQEYEKLTKKTRELESKLEKTNEDIKKLKAKQQEDNTEKFKLREELGTKTKDVGVLNEEKKILEGEMEKIGIQLNKIKDELNRNIIKKNVVDSNKELLIKIYKDYIKSCSNINEALVQFETLIDNLKDQFSDIELEGQVDDDTSSLDFLDSITKLKVSINEKKESIKVKLQELNERIAQLGRDDTDDTDIGIDINSEINFFLEIAQDLDLIKIAQDLDLIIRKGKDLLHGNYDQKEKKFSEKQAALEARTKEIDALEARTEEQRQIDEKEMDRIVAEKKAIKVEFDTYKALLENELSSIDMPDEDISNPTKLIKLLGEKLKSTQTKQEKLQKDIEEYNNLIELAAEAAKLATKAAASAASLPSTPAASSLSSLSSLAMAPPPPRATAAAPAAAILAPPAAAAPAAAIPAAAAASSSTGNVKDTISQFEALAAASTRAASTTAVPTSSHPYTQRQAWTESSKHQKPRDKEKTVYNSYVDSLINKNQALKFIGENKPENIKKYILEETARFFLQKNIDELNYMDDTNTKLKLAVALDIVLYILKSTVIDTIKQKVKDISDPLQYLPVKHVSRDLNKTLSADRYIDYYKSSRDYILNVSNNREDMQRFVNRETKLFFYDMISFDMPLKQIDEFPGIADSPKVSRYVREIQPNLSDDLTVASSRMWNTIKTIVLYDRDTRGPSYEIVNLVVGIISSIPIHITGMAFYFLKRLNKNRRKNQERFERAAISNRFLNDIKSEDLEELKVFLRGLLFFNEQTITNFSDSIVSLDKKQKLIAKIQSIISDNIKMSGGGSSSKLVHSLKKGKTNKGNKTKRNKTKRNKTTTT